MSLYHHWLWFDLTYGNKAPFTHFTQKKEKKSFALALQYNRNLRFVSSEAQSFLSAVLCAAITQDAKRRASGLHIQWRGPRKWRRVLVRPLWQHDVNQRDGLLPWKLHEQLLQQALLPFLWVWIQEVLLCFFLLMLLPLKLLFFWLRLWVLSASPPKTLTLDEVMESARDLSNLSIAHEITVNPHFRVEPSSLPEGRCVNAAYFCNLSHKLFVDYIST